MPKESSTTVKFCDYITKTGIYLLVFLIPIFFLPWTLDNLDFNKQALLIVIVFIAFFSWIMKVLISGKIRLNLNLVYIPLGLLFLTYLVSTVFSLWPHGSFWGWPLVTTESLLTLIGLVLFYLLFTNTLERKEIFYSIVLLVSSGLLAAILGILQNFGKFLLPLDFTKTTSFNTIGTINSLGIFVAVLLPMVVFLVIATRRLWRAFFIVSAILFLVLAVLVNLSTIWWALIVGTILIILLGVQKREYFDSRWLILPMFFLALALIFLFFKFQIPGIKSRPTDVSLTQGTSLSIAESALKEKPILGSGPGTFIYDFSKLKEPDKDKIKFFNPTVSSDQYDAFNRTAALNQTQLWDMKFSGSVSKFFDVLPTTGIAGGISFLLLLGVLVFYGVKSIFEQSEKSRGQKSRSAAKEEDGGTISETSEKTEDGLNVGIFISFLVLVFVYFLSPVNFTLDFVFFLLIGAFICLISPFRKEFLLKPSSILTLGVTFVFTLVFISGLMLIILEGQRYAAEVYYLQGIKYSLQGETDNAVKNLEKAAKLNQKTDLYWRELSQAYLQKVNETINRKDLSEEERNNKVQSYIQFAVNSAKVATDVNTKNAANWNARGFVYLNLIGTGIEQAGEIKDWAVRSYEEASNLEPSSPYYPTQTGIVLLREASSLPRDKAQEREALLNKAKEQFDKAIGLKSDYAPAHFQTALVYQVQGKQKEAIDKLEETKRITSPRDTGLAFQLGLLYYQTKDYQSAKAELERAIAIDPNYSNALYFLGLTYDQLGQKSKAVDVFQKVSNLNPDNEEVKKILNNLKAGKDALEGISLGVPPTVPIEEGQK